MSSQCHVRSTLLALTLAYVARMVIGGSNVRIAFGVPHDSVIASAFVAEHTWAICWGSFCEFVSAIPLASSWRSALAGCAFREWAMRASRLPPWADLPLLPC